MKLRAVLYLSLLLVLLCVTSAFPSPRFIDNGDQTVTDTQTGLVWTRNANLAGTNMSWNAAFDFVAGLNSANGGAGTFGHNDWRDPTAQELMSLVDATRSFPALPAGHPFLNVQSEEYWSASEPNGSSYLYGYGVNMAIGTIYSGHKYNDGFVWPVRGVYSSTSASLTVSPTSVAFGTVPLNTPSAQSLTLANSGTAALVVSGMSVTGTNSTMFSLAPGSCGSLTPSIAPGASCTVSVSFSTPAAGAKNALVRITSNDVSGAAKDVPLSGAGADTIAPVVSQFSVPGTSSGLTVPINAFVATDNVGVTGYCVSEADTAALCSWSAGASSQYSFGSSTPATRTLRCWARDAAGNIGAGPTATVTLNLDQAGPQLTVSALANGRTTGNAVFNIAGTVSDESGVSQLTVNGNSVTVNADGSFSFAMKLATGTTTITTVARDTVGNSTTDSRSITLQQSLPPLAVSYPADNSTSNRNSLRVTGETADSVVVDVSVNGNAVYYMLPIMGPTFSASVNLAAGVNTIEITASDQSGNRNTVKRTVICNAQDPTINLVTPVQDVQTSTAAQTISGSVADAITPVSVSVSDGTSTFTPLLNNGSFSQPLTLSTTKTYNIAVTITEGNGNQSTVRRNILFTKADGGIRFTDNGDQTVTDNLTGLMWTRNANLPDLDVSWYEALDYVDAMNSANGGAGTFGHNDWRLPQVEELESLVDKTRTQPALPLGHPFIEVVSDEYWSSSLVPNKFAYVFGVDMFSGATYSGHDYNFGFVWPVRGERAATRALPAGTTSASYYEQLTAGWGSAPYTWTIASGSLPPGITLDPATGILTGTATRTGVYTFTVGVADATAASEVRPLALTITEVACANAAVRIAASGTGYADLGDAYAHAAEGDLIQLQALDFMSDLLFNRDIQVTLEGGYDCGYSAGSASAGIMGTLRITNGKVKVDRVSFR